MIDIYTQGWEIPSYDHLEPVRKYHLLTEAHDKVVCQRRNSHGEAVPTSHYELSDINRYAMKVRKQILLEFGIDSFEFGRLNREYLNSGLFNEDMKNA